ncbi:MAG: CDP-alcohol phosphatidyltransferase family protein [Actinobacteria bacterium]|nr:CDP-alcohol phosphatidyltransferase family protein [Actinomycetota bacterium]
MRVFDIGARDGEVEVVTDRIWTLPNILSFARIAILPLAFYDLVQDNFTRAFIVLFIFGSTDWFDGFVARRFGQVSKLGKLLDPLSDRLMIAFVGIGMIIAGLLPLWVVLVLVGRDILLVLGAAIFLARGSAPPAVTRTGKAATFGLMFAIGFFLLAAVVSPEGQLSHEGVRAVAWVLFAVNVVLYYVAAVQYIVAVRRGDAVVVEDRPPAQGVD